MLPVLVTAMVAVTGCPAGSTVLASSVSRWLVTAGGANLIAPVNGSLRCEPSTGPRHEQDQGPQAARR